MQAEERMPQSERGRPSAWWHAGVVFLVAIVVRYAFVAELRDSSYLGNIRVSDARTYYQLARAIVEGSAAFEPYWQAPLYPMTLSFFQALFGNGLHTVQWFHIAIGALDCALLFRLTEKLFGSRVAWVAAGISIFYTPFWIFDAQPLPANLTALFYLVLTGAYLRFRDSGRGEWLIASGLLLGAAITTHGLAIFMLPVLLFDLFVRHKQVRPKRGVVLATFMAAAMLAPAGVSVRNSLAAGTPVFISYNAGINLYLGNHRDLEETLGRRGGYEWGELFRDAYTQGADEPSQMNRFFASRAIDEWFDAPGSLLLTTGQKVLLALGANESKRNFPIYPLREDSVLLRAAMFEITLGDRVLFAFPGGVVLPLALLGWLWSGDRSFRSRLPRARARLAGQLAFAHLVGMIVFFPAARYRMPALFLLLPYASMAGVYLYDAARRLATRGFEAGTIVTPRLVGAIALFLMLNFGAANVFRHPVEDRAEHLYFSALWDFEKLRFVETDTLKERFVARNLEAMRLDPRYPEPVGLLAVYYLHRDIERSLSYFARLAELVPNDEDVLQQVRDAKAIRDAGT